MKNPLTIALSRQLGCGGTLVGKRVADRLGFAFMNREILRQAAASLQEEEEVLLAREERISTFTENILRSFSLCVPEGSYSPMPVRQIQDLELYRVEAEIIRSLARRCSSVIVGRGAFHILKDRPDLLTVFIHAPLQFRTSRLMEDYSIADAGEAEAMILESDRQRCRFIRSVAGVDLYDARNYHLAIDTSVTGIDLAAELISMMAEKT